MVIAAWMISGLLVAGCAIDRTGAFVADAGRRRTDGGTGERDAARGRDSGGTSTDAGGGIDASRPGGDGGRPPDAGRMPPPDVGPPTRVDPEWGMPTALGSTADARRCETDPALSSDGRWLFVTRPQAMDALCYENRRFHVFEWNAGAPIHRGTVPDFDPRLDETNHHPVVAGPDLYTFYHQATDGTGDFDIRVVTLGGTPPISVITPTMGVSLNTTSNEAGPSLTPDETRIIFNRDGDFVEAERTALIDWRVVRTHARLRSSEGQGDAAISADGLLMVFMRRVAGTADDADLWWTRRDSTAEEFGDPTLLPAPINTIHAEMDSYLTHTGDLLFVSARGDGVTRRVFLARRVR